MHLQRRKKGLLAGNLEEKVTETMEWDDFHCSDG